jgi:hypothetical protein
MAPQVELARVPEAAAESDILREQLEYLIDHTAGNAPCGCSECQRYLKVRALLLEIFAEPPVAKLQEISTRWAKAA